MLEGRKEHTESKCIRYHFDANGLFAICDPQEYWGFQDHGAQPFVLLSSYWTNAEIYAVEILPGPPRPSSIGQMRHKAPLSKEWVLMFSANLPHRVSRVASPTHRGYPTPALYEERKRTSVHWNYHDMDVALDLNFGGVQVYKLGYRTLVYLSPCRHGEKQNMLSQLALARDILPMSSKVPGDTEALQVGHIFEFSGGPVRGWKPISLS